MVEKTRRKLVAGIGLGAGASLLGYSGIKKIVQSEETAEQRPNLPKFEPDDIEEGYPVRVDSKGRMIGPGWWAQNGDFIALCLSGTSTEKRVGSLEIEDVRGNVVLQLDNVKLQKQQYSNSTPWESGAGWSHSVVFQIPEGLPAGVYFLQGRDDVFFVVRSFHRNATEGTRRISVLMSTNTFNAYSKTLDRGTYGPIHVNKVSFHRPMSGIKSREWLPFLRWMYSAYESANISIDFLVDSDMESSQSMISTELLIVLGHSEYWTRNARVNFDNWVNRGGNALLLTGNTMWWQVRYELDDESVMVCYKNRSPKLDPQFETKLATINWNAPSLDYPIYRSIGADFARGGFGSKRKKEAFGWDGCMISDDRCPLLSGTGLKNGDYFRLFHVVEMDGPPLLGFDQRGFPVPDLEKIGAYKFRIFGFDMGYRAGHTLGSWHCMKPSTDSGTIINISSMPITRLLRRAKMKKYSYLKPDAEILSVILQNCIDALIDENVDLFEDQASAQPVVWSGDLPFDDSRLEGFPWKSIRPKLAANVN